MKRVSVIIPNYNNAHYLECAIRSILTQTFQDYEIIVVDDGSSDNSREVVAKFGDQVRYIYQENKGLGGARNTAILASDAELIGLLDADDEWRPTFLEKMMALTEQYPAAAVYYSAAQGMDSSGKDLPQFFGRMGSPQDFRQTLLRANFIIPSTVVLRRADLVKVGLFEEKNRALHGSEDWDLWLRLTPSYSFVGTGEVLVRYRLHPNTFSANPGHMQAAVRTVVEKHFGPDDGNWQHWSPEKRRAFGGAYRFQALSSVQKQGDWGAATESLRRAFEIDPSLTEDLDLFYELSFGTQPPGYRDSAQHLQLDQNATLVINLLSTVFGPQENQIHDDLLRNRACATANYALGLVAYNTKHRDLSKQLLFRAMTLQPKLLLDQKVLLTWMKSYLPVSLVNGFRQQ